MITSGRWLSYATAGREVAEAFGHDHWVRQTLRHRNQVGGQTAQDHPSHRELGGLVQRRGVVAGAGDQDRSAQVDIQLIGLQAITGTLTHQAHHAVVLATVAPDCLDQGSRGFDSHDRGAIGRRHRAREAGP
jgi:hypothetical protein